MLDGFADALQAKQVHQRSVSAGDDLRCRCIKSLGKGETAIFSIEGDSGEAGSGQIPDILLEPFRKNDLAVVEPAPLAVDGSSARRDSFPRQGTDGVGKHLLAAGDGL